MRKIGVVIDQLNVGGPEKIAFEQVINLNKIGVVSELVVMRRQGIVPDPFPDLMKQVKIVYLDDRLPSYLTKSFGIPGFYFFSFFHLSYPFLLPFVVKHKEYDYLIVHSTYTSFTAVSLKLLKGIPFSAFIWDPITYIIDKVYKEKFSGLKYRIFKNIASFVDRIILHFADSILTGGSAHDVILRCLKKDVIIHAIPPGVNPVKKVHLDQKKDYILLVTAWKEGKSPEFIFDVLNINPYLKFCLVGNWVDEEYKLRFLKLVNDKKYSKNITIVGTVSEKQLNKYYQEALLLLQINNDKGFGMPALEAAGNGTTFIIPEGQGVCELFENNVEGYFTKEKELNRITQLLNLLMNDKLNAFKMGELAWKKVNANYTWKMHANKILENVQKYMD